MLGVVSVCRHNRSIFRQLEAQKQERPCWQPGVGLGHSLTYVELARLPACWQLSPEHSGLINTVLKVLPRLWVFLSNCLFGGTVSATGKLAWEPAQDRKRPQSTYSVPPAARPSCPAAVSPGHVAQLENFHQAMAIPQVSRQLPGPKSLQRGPGYALGPQAMPSCHLLYFKPSELLT